VAHTGYAYKVVDEEHQKLGVKLPKGHCCSYGMRRLRLEEQEYELADGLLCPSDFVAHTFLEKGYPPSKLFRHQYGFDPGRFTPPVPSNGFIHEPFSLVFVARCEPWKGLHYALEAWHASSGREHGTFAILGDFMPGYAERLGSLLDHGSVRVVGFTGDVPGYLRNAHALVLPTIVEGSALVTYEARACGCVLLVSQASGAPCEHMKDALVHGVGDVETLTRHINLLNENRELYARLRTASLATLDQITWRSAARRLVQVYRDAIKRKSQNG
jgi:glycosyltransferase involved in cell wall biosynthesis